MAKLTKEQIWAKTNFECASRERYELELASGVAYRFYIEAPTSEEHDKRYATYKSISKKLDGVMSYWNVCAMQYSDAFPKEPVTFMPPQQSTFIAVIEALGIVY